MDELVDAIILANLSASELALASSLSVGLSDTDTDRRGNVLYAAGILLSTYGQHYTGKLLKSIAQQYGISINGPDITNTKSEGRNPDAPRDPKHPIAQA